MEPRYISTYLHIGTPCAFRASALYSGQRGKQRVVGNCRRFADGSLAAPLAGPMVALLDFHQHSSGLDYVIKLNKKIE